MKVSSVVFTCSLDSLRTLKDGTCKLVLHTQEMEAEEVGRIVKFNNQLSKCLLTTKNITSDKIKSVEDFEIREEDSGKSPSQRLRGVIYRIHEAERMNGVDVEEFEVYYRTNMEKIINHFKDKLNELS